MLPSFKMERPSSRTPTCSSRPRYEYTYPARL
jgi:hypothetical protein